MANKDNYSDRAKTLAKDAAKGVGKEMKDRPWSLIRSRNREMSGRPTSSTATPPKFGRIQTLQQPAYFSRLAGATNRSTWQ